jgi:hypothetical protein
VPDSGTGGGIDRFAVGLARQSWRWRANSDPRDTVKESDGVTLPGTLRAVFDHFQCRIS